MNLQTIKAQLQGKKTYLASASTIILAVLAWLNGEVTDAETMQLVITAILASTLRSGISGTQVKQ